jgi:predicted NAD/FAD-dependent oxidoreductase
VTDERTIDVVVIGAGIAGLVVARELRSAGREVVVLDKGRGVGGRLATRRIGVVGADGEMAGAPALLDHGAPFVDDATHGELVARYGAWPADRGISAAAKHLAVGLDVRLSHRVERVGVHDGAWRIEGAGPDGRFEPLLASSLLVTAPIPQTLELLTASGVELDDAVDAALRAVRYDPCIVVLVVLDGPSGLAPDGVRRPSDGPVELVIDHQLAGASPLPAVTVRASVTASEALWSVPDEDVVARLLAGVGLDAPPMDGTVQVHRWRYSRVAEPVRATHLVAAAEPRMVLAGDAFVGGVDGWMRDGRTSDLGVAYRSGLAATAALG